MESDVVRQSAQFERGGGERARRGLAAHFFLVVLDYVSRT